VISPFLANVYLHYVLDQWVEYERRKPACSEVVIVRYADDFVIGFESKSIAESCLHALRERFAAFGLTLHPEKTRLIEFGRFAASNRAERGEGKPETFNFLGFTHICSTSRKGRFLLKRISIAKRLRAKTKAIASKLRQRMHEPVCKVGAWLASVVRGYVLYFGVPGNMEALKRFRDLVVRAWYAVLRRRSQKGCALNWKRFKTILDSYIPHPQICHLHPGVRFDARYSR